MRAIALLFFLSSPASAFVPLPAVSSQAVNANFLDMAAEISRNNIRNGGTAEQAVKFSSSVQVTGSTVFSGTVKADSAVVLKSTVDVSAATMVGPQIIQVWAHFVGTGTVVIMDSVGVSSVTDIADGEYRVNFSTPFLTSSFATLCTAEDSGASSDRICERYSAEADSASVRLQVLNGSGTGTDPDKVSVAIIGRR